MENAFSNINLIKLILKWKTHLLIILLVSIGLASLFSGSYFIKPKYKSSATLYPSNLIPYSDETPTELMLQLFNSDDIRDSIVDKFNLISHYDIDPTDKYFYTKVVREYEDNIKIKKTEYESVGIEVYDTDPDQACAMVKEMIKQFNFKARSLQREKSMEILNIAEKQMIYKEKQIDSIQVKLKEIRETYGILDYGIQTKETMKNYYRAMSGKSTSTVTKIDNDIQNLEKKGGESIELNNRLTAAMSSYNAVKEEYDNALKDVTKELTYSNYVSSPVPADKKSYPVRWLIVLIVSVATIVLSVLTIIVMENIKQKRELEKSVGEA
jgi:capsule polysaccharide export protein KpsE/RkpR